jgi:stringent starvation protein B
VLVVSIEKEKLQTFTEMFQTGRLIGVYLDPRLDSVNVPDRYRHMPALKLHFGMHLPIPVNHLEVSELGIKAILSFDHAPAGCFLPWKSVFAMLFEDNHSGMEWPQNQPDDITITPPESRPPPEEAKAKAIIAGNEEQGAVEKEERKKMFSVMDGGKEGDEEDEVENEPTEEVARVSLRLVKNE